MVNKITFFSLMFIITSAFFLIFWKSSEKKLFAHLKDKHTDFYKSLIEPSILVSPIQLLVFTNRHARLKDSLVTRRVSAMRWGLVVAVPLLFYFGLTMFYSFNQVIFLS